MYYIIQVLQILGDIMIASRVTIKSHILLAKCVKYKIGNIPLCPLGISVCNVHLSTLCNLFDLANI